MREHTFIFHVHTPGGEEEDNSAHDPQGPAEYVLIIFIFAVNTFVYSFISLPECQSNKFMPQLSWRSLVGHYVYSLLLVLV